MANQCQARDETFERQHGASLVPAPTAAWLWRVEQGVDAVLHPHNYHGFQRLYEAVRERTMELKHAGYRAEQVLLTIKREIASCAAAADDADPTRVAALLDAVVRWCMGAYYMVN
jgi:hypothetical protein